MELGEYLKWNFIIGGLLMVIVLVAILAYSNPYVIFGIFLLLAIFAYRYYRKTVYGNDR